MPLVPLHPRCWGRTVQPFSLGCMSPRVCWQHSSQWCLFPQKENEENQIFISQEGLLQPFAWNRACYSLFDQLRQAAITHETQFPLCAGFFPPRAPPWSQQRSLLQPCRLPRPFPHPRSGQHARCSQPGKVMGLLRDHHLWQEQPQALEKCWTREQGLLKEHKESLNSHGRESWNGLD